jgi:hypothetical protein
MQLGDWRTTPIGYGDRLYLVQAAYLAVIIVVVGIMAKAFLRRGI